MSCARTLRSSVSAAGRNTRVLRTGRYTLPAKLTRHRVPVTRQDARAPLTQPHQQPPRRREVGGVSSDPQGRPDHGLRHHQGSDSRPRRLGEGATVPDAAAGPRGGRQSPRWPGRDERPPAESQRHVCGRSEGRMEGRFQED